MTEYEKAVFSNAIDCFGVDAQLTVAVEENAELIQAITKWKRGKPNRSNIIEEMADVSIMLCQLKMIFGISDRELKKVRTYKVGRLADRLNSATNSLQ